MLINILVWLCERSPMLRRFLWRYWYQKLAKQVPAGEWTLMNYGYAPEAGKNDFQLKLKPEDEADRYCLQLYHKVVGTFTLSGKTVLEVGSGRGGGASFVARYHFPAKMIGVDYSSKAVEFCRERHGSVTNLKFQVGDAEKLPFADATFDAVVNVESSHCYGNIRQFFLEVSRVLKPGGRFLYTDLRASHEMAQLQLDLEKTDFLRVIEMEDITANVCRSIELGNQQKQDQIDCLVPDKLKLVFSEFAGMIGGQVHNGLKSGKLLYWRFVAEKC